MARKTKALTPAGSADVMERPPASLATRLRRAPGLSDKRRAEARLAELLEGASVLLPTASKPSRVRGLLLALADHSPFLWSLVTADHERAASLLYDDPEERLARLVASARGSWAEEPDLGSLMRRLRALRAELALLVACADCGGVWSVEEVTSALTQFADACVGAAIRFLLAEAVASGRMRLPDTNDPEAGSGLVVLALGKHGAGELNYSSDIDLVIFFHPDAPLREGLEPSTFFLRMTHGLVKILQERTPDGYVFRVDLRLRPDPSSTSVAISIPAALSYYEQVGQNWERAAFIKARVVAGDRRVGERFLKNLVPFVWRKYFDFATIADIHAMKRQIHVARGHEAIAVLGHDIKLGRGGIREIEFFVQTQQLVFGGRRPALRGQKTLDMLSALAEERWISPGARDDLSGAYRFLRMVEHRLQMIADEQTQRLPDDEADLTRFAKFCGFAGRAAFETELTMHAEKVQRHYALLFEEGPDLATESGSLVFTGTIDDPETLETLVRVGFRDPAAVTETVRGWHFGRRSAVTSARAREVLTELTPALIGALGRTADPDAALTMLDQAFGRMPAAVELLSILRSNDRLLGLFADLLGSAPRLADIVAERPHVLDALIDPAFADPTLDVERVKARIKDAIGEPASFEEFLDRARDTARLETFVAGARMLSGIFPTARAGEAFTAIAEAMIEAALAEVAKAFAAHYGDVPGGRAVVAGLGRLGAREMTASSDLDLVLLYDFNEKRPESTGPRSIHAVVYYTRLTQRLLGALTAPTRRGHLYEVDMRLRPEGRKGPVATQFKGFLGYQSGGAETWEHMALTRARIIAGDRSLAVAAGRAIRGLLAAPRDRARLAADVRAMRALLASEKGEDDPWDLKLAAGGLVDIEFIAQFLVLANAHAAPAVLDTSTGKVLEAAIAARLLGPGDGETLRAAHAFLSTVFQWQRLTVEGRFDADVVAPSVLRRIAQAVGLPDDRVLLQQLRDTRAGVREVFNRVLR